MNIIVLKSFLPEIFFSCAILFQLIFNAKIVNNLKNNFPLISREIFSQSLFILFILALFYYDLRIEAATSTYSLVNNETAITLKFVLVLIGIVSLFIVSEAFVIQKLNFSEYYSIVLLSILALLIMISAGDLIMFYLSMEMQALCFYILAAFNRNNTFSVEAGLKYFVSGSFISGFFLLGSSFIYGGLGTVNLHDIFLLTSFSVRDFSWWLEYVIVGGCMLVVATLLFKLGCAPFHFWVPDVYEGAPLASTYLFSVLPKLPLIIFFMKFIISINNIYSHIADAVVISGLISVFLGTFFALTQKRLKRLIIYSSIAQVGFIVVCLGVNTIGSFVAALFFVFIYILTSILIWGLFILLNKSHYEYAKFNARELTPLFISSLANLFIKSKEWAFVFAIVMFSIAGIPPLAGFLAKADVLYELILSDRLYIAISLIFISAISTFYYLRILKVIFFEPRKSLPLDDFTSIPSGSPSLYAVLSVAAFLLIFLFFFPNGLLLFCKKIVLGLYWF